MGRMMSPGAVGGGGGAASFATAVVVKGNDGLSGEDVFICHSLEEVGQATSAITAERQQAATAASSECGFVIQEYVPGPERNINLIVIDGEIKASMVREYAMQNQDHTPFILHRVSQNDLVIEQHPLDAEHARVFAQLLRLTASDGISGDQYASFRFSGVCDFDYKVIGAGS